MMKKLLTAVLIALLAIAPLKSIAADPYEINVILPSTGGAAQFGLGAITTLHVVESFVNKTGGIRGRPLKFVYLDDQSNPQVAVQLTNQVIAQGAQVVFGSMLVATCGAMAPLLQKSGPIMYCLSSGFYPPPGSYGFVGAMASKDVYAVALRYLREKGLKKIAMLSSTDGTGQDGERGVDALLSSPEGAGMELVDREHFNPSDISVAAQLAHVKASGAQAMLVWVTGAPFGMVLHGASDAGINFPIVGTASNLVYSQLEGYSSFVGDNLYIAGAVPGDASDRLPPGHLRDVVKTYQKEMATAGIKVDQGTVTSWDPALLLVDALRKLGPTANAAQIRDYLNTVHDWTGVFGQYDFREYPQRGLGPNLSVLVRWDKAKGTWVSVSAPGGAPLK
jgi:branched-chain amino acid transport system substrate-binding protein